MLIALSIALIIAVLGLVGSIGFMIFIVYRLKLAEMAKDLTDYKYNVLDEPKIDEIPDGTVEIDL